MKMKLPVLTALTIGLICSGAQAINLKAAIYTVDEVVDVIRKGQTPSKSVVSVGIAEDFRVPINHFRIANVRRNIGHNLDVLVSRGYSHARIGTTGEPTGMEYLTVRLVSGISEKLANNEQALKWIQQTPWGFNPNDEIGTALLNEIYDSGLGEYGPEILRQLIDSRQVKYLRENLDDLEIRVMDGSATDTDMNMVMREFLLEPMAGPSRHAGIMTFPNNMYFSRIAGENGGIAATFEFRLTIPKQATSEQIGRILELIVDSAELAF